MKYLILSLIFFSNLVHAENWLNKSKIKSGSIEAYSLKSDCERISGEECFDLGENPSTVFSEVDIEIDDTAKPKHSKRITYKCGEYCQSLWSQGSPYTDCLEGESPILNLDLSQIYCSKFLGYDKKLSKTIKIDSEKVKTYIEKKQKEIELKEIKKKKRLESIDSLKAIDWAKVDTIAKLKVIVKALVDETLKDEE